MSQQKDLGVIPDADLKFDEHNPTEIKNSKLMVGLIRRNKQYLHLKSFLPSTYSGKRR